MTTAPAAAAASSRVSSAAHHVLSSGSDNDSSSGSGVNSSTPASGSMSDRKRVLKAPASRRAALVDVSFTVAPGSLTCLVGPVGCGKSSLLMAVLGELPAAGGVAGVAPTTSTSGGVAPATSTPSVACSIAYVSQTPFLLTGSIRDNITFGLPFDEAKYAAAVEACAMVPDLAGFADGSDTVIGGACVVIALAGFAEGGAAVYNYSHTHTHRTLNAALNYWYPRGSFYYIIAAT